MLEQYLKAIDVFDSENTRCWSRFNLFTGFQLIVVAGLAANFDDLAEHRLVGSLLIIAALVFSIFSTLVMWLSTQIHMGMFRAILELEGMDDSLILLGTYKKHTHFPVNTIAKCCVLMSGFLCVFWVALLIAFLVLQGSGVGS